jgi:hypothetical protein
MDSRTRYRVLFLNSDAQFPEPDQLLELDDDGFGDHRTGATRTGRSGDRCQQMREWTARSHTA